MTTLQQLAESYERLVAALQDADRLYPNARVVRNDAGNLSVLNGAGLYVGWIDVLTGDFTMHP